MDYLDMIEQIVRLTQSNYDLQRHICRLNCKIAELNRENALLKKSIRKAERQSVSPTGTPYVSLT